MENPPFMDDFASNVSTHRGSSNGHLTVCYVLCYPTCWLLGRWVLDGPMGTGKTTPSASNYDLRQYNCGWRSNSTAYSRMWTLVPKWDISTEYPWNIHENPKIIYEYIYISIYIPMNYGHFHGENGGKVRIDRIHHGFSFGSNVWGNSNRPGGAEGAALLRELPWCKMGTSARFGGCQMVKSLGSDFP